MGRRFVKEGAVNVTQPITRGAFLRLGMVAESGVSMTACLVPTPRTARKNSEGFDYEQHL
jgi:hypothetical protein